MSSLSLISLYLWCVVFCHHSHANLHGPLPGLFWNITRPSHVAGRERITRRPSLPSLYTLFTGSSSGKNNHPDLRNVLQRAPHPFSANEEEIHQPKVTELKQIDGKIDTISNMLRESEQIHQSGHQGRPSYLQPEGSMDKRTNSHYGLAETIQDNQPLPWACPSHRVWRNFEGVYPGRIRETVCETGMCMGGHFNCTPVHYTTQLLQLCPNSSCGRRDARVPYNFRSSWTFIEKRITVGCACTR